MAEVLATGYQRSTKQSRVGVGSGPTYLAFADWSATASGADLGTNNFFSYDVTAGEAYDEGIIGFLDCALSFGGDWDANENPVDPNGTPGLYIRDDLADLVLVVNFVDTPEWNFDYARILSVQNGGNVEGLVTFTVGSAKSQGPFDYPSGSV